MDSTDIKQVESLERFITEELCIRKFIERIGCKRINEWYPHWFEIDQSDIGCDTDDDSETDLTEYPTARLQSFTLKATAVDYPCIICNDPPFQNQDLLMLSSDSEALDQIADHSELSAQFIQYRDACPVPVELKLLRPERATRFADVRRRLCDAGFSHRILEPLALIPVPSLPGARFALFQLLRGVQRLTEWVTAQRDG
jgi:hypothetical protein